MNSLINKNTTGYFFTIAIAVLFAVVFSKLTDQLLGYEHVNKMCDNKSHYFLQHDSSPLSMEKMKCFELKNKIKNKLENKKFIIMIIIGLLA